MLFAYIRLNRSDIKFLNAQHSKKVQIAFLFSLIILVALNFFEFNFGLFNNEIYSCFFGIMIFYISYSDSIQVNIPENLIFNFLGKISFGLYMYQAITLIVVFKLFVILNLKSLSLVILTQIVLLIIVSFLSFRYIETPILNLKNRLT